MKRTHLVGVFTLLLAVGVAHAQEQNCVQLKTTGQKEEHYVDAQGKQATRLVTPGKVLPGDEIVWTITASNSCKKSADKVVVNNAVPEHMVYVDDSAAGANADIAFSLNGREYAQRNALVVHEADGSTRAARADEIKAVRWVLKTPIAAQQSLAVSYRAKVK